MNRKTHRASCQCGAARAEMTGALKFVGNCHCEACRKATGAAVSTWVGFNDEQVRWLTEKPAYYASSKGVQRAFCAKCGTPLTYASDKWPGETHFLIGVLEHPENYTPQGEVFVDEALPWAHHIKSLPQ